MRSGDLEIFSILGYSSPGEFDILLCQHLNNFLIAERVSAVLFSKDFFNDLLNAL